MIYGKLEELVKYIPECIRFGIGSFLDNISADMEEGTYELYGDKVYAKVVSYHTKTAGSCRIEAHDRYIDIQVTLKGAEGISIFPREKLTIEENREKADVYFFQNGVAENAFCKNYPGFFTLLMPEDAHRPQEKIDNEGFVKKFVIKVNKDLMNNFLL